MRVYKNLILLLAVVVMGTSCSVTKQSAYSPSSVQLELSMADLEYLGDVEISVDYRTYGLFRVIDEINGQPYDGKEIRHANMSGTWHSPQPLKGLLPRASFKVFDEYPQANYCLVVKQESKIKRLFLGNEVHEEAVIKVYKFK